ncbi:MAG TPA: hypothetical protein VLG27_01520 [Candidatus Saccharimonadia bacterium]|nr:hypothetical protein [Candidatus Saccharimonadia bacterium]
MRAIFQAFMGAVALGKHSFYVVTAHQLAVFNYTAWGWGDIILAIVLFTAGFSLLHGGLWGRVVGVLAAAIGLLANLVFLPAYPIWCIVAIIIDSFILYALIVHGDEAKA